MSILKDLILLFTFFTFVFTIIEYVKLKKVNDLLKKRLTETLTHDLKTPTLAQLRGVELLQNESLGMLNFEQKELLKHINSSCKYTLDMISMMLKTYSLDYEKKKSPIENFSLSELLIECFDEMSDTAKKKQLELVYTGNLKSILIKAVRADIKTVILYLLQNAIENSNKNEKIYVSINSSFNQLKMEIKNKGVTFATSSRFSAIGESIKLDLSKKIITSYNGRILTSREENDTNRFMFTLPIKTWECFNFT